MQAFVVTVLVVIQVFSSVVTARNLLESHDAHDVEGGYWRNFKGEIPKDALQGGLNCHEEPTFIGQVLYKDQLLPAKIDPHENKVYFESGFVEFVATENIKIFCTQHPEQFEWLTTDTKHMHDMASQHILVDGGFEKEGTKIFIGRKQMPDELAVGKVASTKDHTTLNITKDGVCVQHGEFQVLTYNPHIKMEKKKKHGEVVVINTHGEVSVDHSEPECGGASVVINVYNKK